MRRLSGCCPARKRTAHGQAQCWLKSADAMFCSRKQPDAERAEELKELEELDRKREAEASKEQD